MSLTPPLRAERIARWSLARVERQGVLGDMHEEFVHISEQSGAAAAERWYWRQTLVSILPNALRRFRNDTRRWVRLAWGCFGMAYVWLTIALAHQPLLMKTADAVEFAVILAFILWAIVSAVFGKNIRKRRTQLRARLWIDSALVIGFLVQWSTFWTPFWRFAGVFVDVAFLLRFSVELWPWWPKDLAPAPAATAESFVRIAAESDDGKRHRITLRVPNAPLGMSDLVLSAERNTFDHWLAALGARFGMPTLRRRFTHDDTLRVYAAVNGARSPVDGAMDVIDASGRVVQTLPIVGMGDLEFSAKRADNDEESAPQPEPGPVGKVEVKLPLAHLEPGPYRLRLTMQDTERLSIQHDEFVVTAPAVTKDCKD